MPVLERIDAGPEKLTQPFTLALRKLPEHRLLYPLSRGITPCERSLSLCGETDLDDAPMEGVRALRDDARGGHCLHDLVHGLRGDERAARELRVRELAAGVEHRERGVLGNGEPEAARHRSEPLTQGPLEAPDGIGDARLREAPPPRAGLPFACPGDYHRHNIRCPDMPSQG